jgi:protein TonB
MRRYLPPQARRPFYWMSIVCVSVALATPVWTAADSLTEVKQLYAAAAYEDALGALAKLNPADLGAEAEEYRALCLLALSREAEAARAVERLVRIDPTPLADLENRPPRFVSLYRRVSDRVVPDLARTAYTDARASFDSRNYAEAVTGFHRALALMRAGPDQSLFGDLPLLVKEFLILSEERAAQSSVPAREDRLPSSRTSPQVVPAPAPAAPASSNSDTGASGPSRPAPAAASPAAGSTVAPARPTDVPVEPVTPFPPVARVFSPLDRDVVPPIVVDQALPSWNPPLAFMNQRTYTGRIQVIVGLDGMVSSADILQPSVSVYDALLLKATKQWRYRPAMKGGQPVRYRRVIDYVLSGPAAAASPP